MRLRAEQSEKRGATGRPKGTPGNMRFDLFVRVLCAVAQRMGGKLTIFKSESAQEGEEVFWKQCAYLNHTCQSSVFRRPLEIAETIDRDRL